MKDAASLCQPEADAKGIALTVEIAVRHQVLGDPGRLRQIFTNLLKNAVKFTPSAGSVLFRECDGPDGRARVIVQDTGIGVEADVLQRMFNPFEQGERAITNEFSGLGLGLAISKGLVEAHGGTITAASRGKNRGTTMTVDLPLGKSVEAAKTSTRLATDPARGKSCLSILLVDDHHDTLAAMSRPAAKTRT